MSQPYSKPPIIEAVIEWRFESPITETTMKKASGRFAGHYPREDTGVLARINPEGQPVMEPQLRRSALDQTEMVVVGPSNFIVSQTAPYPGWEIFRARAETAWDDWKASIGYRKIVRIGMRYINRIDIPRVDDSIRMSRYLTLHCEAPESVGTMNSYALQASANTRGFAGSLTMSSALIPPPLVGYYSVLLDLDLSTEIDIPQKDDDMFALLEKIRDERNRVFESCITAETRALFL